MANNTPVQSDTRTQLEQAAHASGPLHHHTPLAPSDEPYPDQVLDQLRADAAAVIARYPQKRSALLPLLHLVQSVDGSITGRGVHFCADQLDLTTAEVSGVATFYTQYKRHPNGQYTVGVCTNTLCAIMGGDQIFDEVSEHLGIGHDETTADGAITLERVECNAACDYAPVVMVNWEFFDDQTPESTKELADALVAGRDVVPTRGASSVCTFKQMSRVLAGFTDGRADEGVGAGGPSLEGLRIAKERGWLAPVGAEKPYAQGSGADSDRETAVDTAAADESTEPKRGQYGSVNAPANEPDELPGGEQVPASDGGADDGNKERR